jgi:hypothetical protein
MEGYHHIDFFNGFLEHYQMEALFLKTDFVS